MSNGTLGSIHTPDVGHHRWTRSRRLGMATGGPGFNRTARVMLFEMRWREPPPEHGLRTFAWFVSITLHLLFAAAMLLTRPTDWVEPQGGGGDESAIEVRLISPEQTRTPPPPPTLHLPKRVPRKGTVVRAPRKGPVSVPKAPVAELPAIPRADVPRIETTIAAARPSVSPPVPVIKAASVAEAESRQAPPPRPSPPRVIVESSPMAVPPPRVESPRLVVARPSTPELEPVPAAGAGPRADAPQVGMDVQDVSRPAPATAMPAQVRATPAPVPMQPVPVSPPSAPQVQIEAEEMAPPSAPAPQVQRPAVDVQAIAEAPSVPVPVPAQAPPRVAPPQVQTPQAPASLPEAEPGPLSIPPAAPVQQRTEATAKAQVQPAAPPAPAPAASTSWAQSSAADRFSQAVPVAPSGTGALRTYGKGGSLALTGGTGPGKVPAYIQRRPQGNSDVMTRSTSRIVYTPTRFEQYWVPYGQSSLDTLLDRLIDKLTVTKKFDLPNGIHGECKFSPLLFVAVIGCGANPPPVPTAASNDPRLNMAPAKPLAPGLDKPAEVPAPPASQTLPTQDKVSCAMAKVSGTPPPPGCPGGPASSDKW